VVRGQFVVRQRRSIEHLAYALSLAFNLPGSAWFPASSS
jgi:hypothetical protein